MGSLDSISELEWRFGPIDSLLPFLTEKHERLGGSEHLQVTANDMLLVQFF